MENQIEKVKIAKLISYDDLTCEIFVQHHFDVSYTVISKELENNEMKIVLSKTSSDSCVFTHAFEQSWQDIGETGKIKIHLVVLNENNEKEKIATTHQAVGITYEKPGKFISSMFN